MPAKSVGEVSVDAHKYSKEIFSSINFYLGALSDENFKVSANVIVTEIGRAFAEGYYRGVEDQKRRK